MNHVSERLVGLTVKIDRSDREFLEDMADDDDRTVSFIVRKLIEDFVDGQRKMQEAQVIKVKRRA